VVPEVPKARPVNTVPSSKASFAIRVLVIIEGRIIGKQR